VDNLPLKDAVLDIETEYLPYVEVKEPKYEGASGFIEISSLKSYFVKGNLDNDLETSNLKKLSDFIKTELKIGLTLNFDRFTAEESRLYMTFLNRLKENVKLVALLEERGSKEITLKGSYYFGGETRVSKVETQPLDEKLKFLTDFVEIKRGNIYRFYLTSHTYIEGELTLGRCLNIGGLNFELVWLFNGGKEWISGFRKPAIQMLKPGTVLIIRAKDNGALRRLTYIGQTEFVPVYENRGSINILGKKVKLHNYGWNFGILGPYKGG
jgi:CRISPR-associated protein Cmr3